MFSNLAGTMHSDSGVGMPADQKLIALDSLRGCHAVAPGMHRDPFGDRFLVAHHCILAWSLPAVPDCRRFRIGRHSLRMARPALGLND
jgi:hypothetical protein